MQIRLAGKVTETSKDMTRNTLAKFEDKILQSLPLFFPQLEGKKWQKSAILDKFLDLCLLRNAFCHLSAPHKNF